MRDLSARARQILDSAQAQLDQIDKTRTELTTQVRIQAERVELVLEDVLTRAQDVVGVLQNTVLRPVREVSGFVAGIRTAMRTFLAGRRPTVDRATHDEEMFI